MIFFSWPPPTGSGEGDLLVHVPSSVITIYFCQAMDTGNNSAYITTNFLVCLSINNYTIVIILATSPVLLHFNSYSWLVTKLSDWSSLLLHFCYHLHNWYYCCSLGFFQLKYLSKYKCFHCLLFTHTGISVYFCLR